MTAQPELIESTPADLEHAANRLAAAAADDLEAKQSLKHAQATAKEAKEELTSALKAFLMIRDALSEAEAS